MHGSAALEKVMENEGGWSPEYTGELHKVRERQAPHPRGSEPYVLYSGCPPLS